MKKKIMLAIAALGVTSMASFAGINVQYYVAYGLYPFGGNPTDATPGSGLLAANGTGSTILQLVYAGGNGVADGNVASLLVTGDDQLLEQRLISTGTGYDEWGYTGTFPAPYTNPIFTAGNVFVRVFQTATPTAGQYYYDTATLTLQDRQSDVAFTQTLTVDTPSAGIALNLPIVPEPSVMAFLGIGGLVLAARRRIRNA